METPKDKKASLVIHGFVDKVIAGVMDRLNMRIPPFVRIDLFQVILTHTLSSDKRFVNWILRVASVHGQKAPLPFIKYVEVSFLDGQNYKEAVLHKQPFQLKRRTVKTKIFEVLLKLNFSDGCGCLSSQIKVPIDFKVSTDCFNYDKDAILQKLRDTATGDPCCGRHEVIEKKPIPDPRSEATVYAIVTNVLQYNKTAPESNGSVMKGRLGGLNGIETSWKRSRSGKRKPRS
ncbi:NAD-dependent protein deacetylase SRT1 [Vitis vinifera]|uniref:NAD-dependent protein deacetylase SRT1 n=1 Tax=Vitis vinifera TaxID=29760 RepID=A0A438ERE2_VITVI|nr:NAD-dependent protein deacetylase SRT1 [Vitis vinifera]